MVDPTQPPGTPTFITENEKIHAAIAAKKPSNLPLVLVGSLFLIALLVGGIVIVYSINKSNRISAEADQTADRQRQEALDKIHSTLDTTSETTNTEEEEPADEQTAKPQTHQLDIQSFTHQDLTINVGDTVVWTNQDAAQHTVTSDDGTTFGSELLRKSDTFSFTFTAAGEFPYHCNPHQSMQATITVQ